MSYRTKRRIFHIHFFDSNYVNKIIDNYKNEFIEWLKKSGILFLYILSFLDNLDHQTVIEHLNPVKLMAKESLIIRDKIQIHSYTYFRMIFQTLFV